MDDLVVPGPVPADDVRIGDAERRAVDESLHRAVGAGVLTLGEYDERAGTVWAARTRGELAAVTRDLPGSAAPAAPPPGPAGAAARTVAVMSQSRLEGPFPAGPTVEAYALMGSAVVDLRQGDLPAALHVRAVAVMGEVTVLVPAGVAVHLTGWAVMGDRRTRLGPPDPGGPVVHLEARAVMGSIGVRTEPQATSGQPAVAAGSRELSAGRRPRRRRGLGRVVKLAVAAALLVGAGSAVASGTDNVTVMGSRTVVVPAGTTAVDVGVLMGSSVVVVPDGAAARTHGLLVMGSTECRSACTTAPRAGTVEVGARGAMGSVQVLTQSEYDARQVSRLPRR